MPAWQERNPADVEVALVELLAYVGDHLSYFQDSAATEAYLGTARQRISVRRHARLLDYFMHDGCNARTWVCFDYPARTICCCRKAPNCSHAGRVGRYHVSHRSIWPGCCREEKPEVFETLHAVTLQAARSEIKFYTWGDSDCCLPAGATQGDADQDARSDPYARRRPDLRRGEKPHHRPPCGCRSCAPARGAADRGGCGTGRAVHPEPGEARRPADSAHNPGDHR